MSPNEAYFYLLTDSFMTTLLLPPHRALVLDTMRLFGGYSLLLMWGAAAAGSIVGGWCNWILGWMLCTCRKAQTAESSPQETGFARWMHDVAMPWLKRHGHILVILSAVPSFGEAIMVLAGFAGIPFKRYAVVAGISQVVYIGATLMETI